MFRCASDVRGGGKKPIVGNVYVLMFSIHSLILPAYRTRDDDDVDVPFCGVLLWSNIQTKLVRRAAEINHSIMHACWAVLGLMDYAARMYGAGLRYY